MLTEKRIHVSLNEKSLQELRELQERLKESQSTIVRSSISNLYDNIVNPKEEPHA